MEVNKAFKRRIAREKKRQEKIDLAPEQALQPKSRTIRYDNMKSAMAEETVLAMVMKEPSLMEQTKLLTPASFSSELLGRVYSQFCLRYAQGLSLTPGALEDMTPDEISHITGIAQRHNGTVNETALADCVRTILMEHQSATVATEDDLMKLREQMKERKGSKL
jgi:DNA primase